MRLVKADIWGATLEVHGNMAGWQQALINGQLVSQTPAQSDFDGRQRHEFTIEAQDKRINMVLEVDTQFQPFSSRYKVFADEQLIAEGNSDEQDLSQVSEGPLNVKSQKFSFVGLASLGFKLLKSTKFIKALLAASTMAAYSWLFSPLFAAVLIACLVFHEYGHLRAMKSFGMKTKGMYLIPFVGGLAVGDDKINTRWQGVYIAMMGPTFGLALSIVAMGLYIATGELFFAAVSTFNALLNLFNLLPILPLDGGHVLKSISFSFNTVTGLVMCLLGAALGVVITYYLGLTLLGFLLAIGTFEIIFEWRYRHHALQLPMRPYGVAVSAAWYVAVIAGLVGIMFFAANTGDEVMALPLLLLNS
ncbi:MAG: site-2 protease family protein [Gammaproteobacteria bacterium]|nr:site-2 protease family protein [Gammaproteobacteria bacterium]